MLNLHLKVECFNKKKLFWIFKASGVQFNGKHLTFQYIIANGWNRIGMFVEWRSPELVIVGLDETKIKTEIESGICHNFVISSVRRTNVLLLITKLHKKYNTKIYGADSIT